MTPEEKRITNKLKSLRRTLPHRPRKVVGKRLRPRVLVWMLTLSLFAVALPPFFWPVIAPTSSGFLFRLKPDSVLWALEIHHGIDLAAPKGTRVSASALGVVSAAGRSAELGKFVKIEHLWGFSTLYGHLDKVEVGVGQLIVPGLQSLGRVGATGRATGPHLHFGVFFLGVALPPEFLLVFHSLRRFAVGF